MTEENEEEEIKGYLLLEPLEPTPNMGVNSKAIILRHDPELPKTKLYLSSGQVHGLFRGAAPANVGETVVITFEFASWGIRIRTWLGRFYCRSIYLNRKFGRGTRAKANLVALLAVLGASLLFFLEVAEHVFPELHLDFVLSHWVTLFFVCCSAFLFLRNLRELTESKRERSLAQFIRFRIADAAILTFDSAKDPDQDLTNFVALVLQTFSDFGKKEGKKPRVFTRDDVKFTIMLKSPESQRLGVKFQEPPDTGYTRDFESKPGAGGAGLAFKKAEKVYFPSVWFGNAISISENGRIGFLNDVFVKSRQGDPFESLLCVPILLKNRVYGVLNLGSAGRNAFKDLDFDIAEIVATMLAVGLDKFARCKYAHPGEPSIPRTAESAE